MPLLRRGRSPRQIARLTTLGRRRDRLGGIRSFDVTDLVLRIADGQGPTPRPDHLDLFEQGALVPINPNLLDLILGIEVDDVDLRIVR